MFILFTPKTTEQNLIVRIGKSEAEITNNKCVSKTYIRHTGGGLQLKLCATHRPLFKSNMYVAVKTIKIHGASNAGGV